MRIEFGGFAIVTTPGITIRTPWHEAFIGHVAGPARFDCWRADGALFVRFGRRELVANRLPYRRPAVSPDATVGA